MNSGVLPAWIILPITLGMMLLVSSHMSRIQRSEEPSSRKRIRVANGWIVLFALGFTAAGFSLISPSLNPRLFFIVWAISLVLITTTVMLAMADVLNTLRLIRRVGVRMRQEAARTSVELGRALEDARETDGESRGG